MSEIEELKKRLEQLETVVLAIALNQPISSDEHGRLIAVKREPELRYFGEIPL